MAIWNPLADSRTAQHAFNRRLLLTPKINATDADAALRRQPYVCALRSSSRARRRRKRKIRRIGLLDLHSTILDHIVEIACHDHAISEMTATAFDCLEDEMEIDETDRERLYAIERMDMAAKLCLICPALLPSARRAMVKTVRLSIPRKLNSAIRFFRRHPDIRPSLERLGLWADACKKRRCGQVIQLLKTGVNPRQLLIAADGQDLLPFVDRMRGPLRRLENVHRLDVYACPPRGLERPIWRHRGLPATWKDEDIELAYVKLLRLYADRLTATTFRAPHCYRPEPLVDHKLPALPRLRVIRNSGDLHHLPSALVSATQGECSVFCGFVTPEFVAHVDVAALQALKTVCIDISEIDLPWMLMDATPPIALAALTHVESLRIDAFTHYLSIDDAITSSRDLSQYRIPVDQEKCVSHDLPTSLADPAFLPRLKRLIWIEPREIDGDWPEADNEEDIAACRVEMAKRGGTVDVELHYRPLIVDDDESDQYEDSPGYPIYEDDSEYEESSDDGVGWPTSLM